MLNSGSTSRYNTPMKESKKVISFRQLYGVRYIWLYVCIISLSQLIFGTKYRYLSFPLIDENGKYEKSDVHIEEKYAIFYHSFINPENVTHSLGNIEEQLAQWQASRYAGVTLYYTQLGDTSTTFPCPSHGYCELLIKNPTGWERDTFVKISIYCQQHTDHNVIYLHSKGTFHSKEENNHLRKVLTSSALSDQCNHGLNNTQCNICSARFSPLPHWHTPGNMWTAKCSHINKLYPILDFQARVTEIVGNYTPDLTNLPASTVGIDRYADEHWVHTHPQVYPCDVYPDLQWMFGHMLLDVNLPLELVSKAPRNFDIRKKKVRYVHPPGPQVRLNYRLYELWQLYNETPGKDSFVWTWYKRARLL